MTKAIIVLTPSNAMGSDDLETNLIWGMKLKSETERFYEISLQHKSKALVGATTLMGAALKNRFLNTLKQYPKIYVISQRNLQNLIKQNQDLNELNNLSLSNDLKVILNQYYQNKTNELYILGGLKIYDQTKDYLDYIIVLRTQNEVTKMPRKFLINFDDWKMVSSQRVANFQEEHWVKINK